MSLAEHLENAYNERESSRKSETVVSLPRIQDFDTKVSWGVFAYTIHRAKLRLVRQSTAVCYPRIQTPAEVARDYLDYYHPRKLRANSGMAYALETHISPPLYVYPQLMRDAVYLDLQAAYFTICRVYGWNVDYNPGKWLIAGRPTLDFPLPEDKIARNCLVSLCLPSHSNIWTGTKMVRVPTRNQHINRSLWWLTCSILHSIASFAEQAGAIYFHTDGCILPEAAWPMVADYAARFGLVARVKYDGFSATLGFGNWMVGDKRTKAYDPAHIQKPYRYLVNIEPREQERISRVAWKGYASLVYNEK